MDASSQSSSFESSNSFVPDFGGDGDRPVEHSPRGRYIRFDVRLGTGAYKTVFKAYDTDQGIDVAWNAIDIGQLPATEKTRIIQEVQLLQKLEHKNIINFYGSWFSKEKNQVVFITEIMTSGTLKSYIKRVQFIKWKIIRRWCVQILEGLHYLHSQSPPVIHRDLKCDNIFINGNTGDLRIGDLGLSTQLAVHTRTKAQSVLGTPEFMAPELYDESYDEKVDIYAFGMCVLEMVTKEVPYSECVNPAQIYKKVTAGIRPKGLQRVVSAPARDFIELCLSRGNGEIDVTTEYLLNHDFLKAQDDDGDMVECLTEDEADIKARDMARHDSLNDASMQDIDNEDCERLDDTSEEKGDGAVPQSRSSGANDTNVEDPSDPSARPVAVSATSNSEDGSLNPADVAVAAVAAQQHNEMEQESSAVETIEEEGEEGPIANDNRGADEGVENFLRDLPGSEIGIHNNRMNVMGGRGHRLELEDVSEEDDSPPLSAESDNTMTSSSVAPPAESPVTVERGTKPRKRHDIKSCKDPQNEHSILLSLRIIIEGKSKEIKFSFNLFTDSTHEVACELAADVGILEPDLEDIADSIAFLVTEGKIANLSDVEEDVWEEAPEPHAFLAKPLPPVAQMKFVMTAPDESPFPPANASGLEVPRSPLPSPPHAKETYAEEMNHPSLEDRSRGMSLGSMIDNDAYKELMMSTPLPTSVPTEDLVFDSSEEDEHDIGDATLDEAIRNEEEKHQKEVERFRKKMQEFEEKKRRMVTRQGGKMEESEEAPKEGGGYPHSAQSSPGRPLASKTV